MRFSIRDLMWLMATVALAATVFVERVAMRRHAAQWAEERAKLEEKSAATLAIREARILGLGQQNALLQHQIVVIMERQREMEEAQRRAAAALPSPLRPPFAIPDITATPDESEK